MTRRTPPTPQERTSDAAELASLAGTLQDTLHRLTTAAQRYDGTAHEDVAASLFEAERLLRGGLRALQRAERALG